MTAGSATAISHPNIAFIKYWGNREQSLRIPSNGSISLTLDHLSSETTVEFSPDLSQDEYSIDGNQLTQQAEIRVSTHIELIRQLSGITLPVRVQSKNNFPVGTGIAS